ncbi:type II secretion system F family protein [archaeon]|nr:type II secretion system F family protein [archaeon]
MSTFSYKAKNKLSENVSGDIDGASENEVAETLIKSGLYPFFIEEKKIDTEKSSNVKFNILIFTRQLYVLVRSGVPIVRALKTLEVSSESKEMREMFRDIKSSLDSGYEIYIALQKHPDKFPPFYVNMVRVGELAGQLEAVLEELYKFLDFEQDIKGRAKAALRYPMFVLVAIVLALSVMMIFVIPTFASVYKGFHAELPLPTRVLIGTSNFVMNYGLLLIFAITSSIYMFLSYIKTDLGQYWWDKFKFSIPLVGKIVKKSVLARFTKSFSLSLKSGIPIVQSLNNMQYVMENSYFSKHVESMRESIERGNTLYGSMKNTGVFEPLVLEMFSTGEEAGELEVMCDEISNMYDKEIDFELKNLSSYIEPIMLVFIGGLVLVMALGMFLPIWDLGSVVMKK